MEYISFYYPYRKWSIDGAKNAIMEKDFRGAFIKLYDLLVTYCKRFRHENRYHGEVFEETI